MKRYELIVAGILLSVSTILKICAVITLCHVNLTHLDETVHTLVHVVQVDSQNKHLPLEALS